MSYTPTVWKTGDVVSSLKLNKLENGLAAAATADDLTQLDKIINGEIIPITFTQTGTGYVYERSPGIVNVNYTAGGTGNNQLMVINDFTQYGIKPGSKMSVIVGWATGYTYAVGFDNKPITETADVMGGVPYTSETNPQTLEFVVPVGATSIAIFNRKTVYAEPSINLFINGLIDDFDELKETVEEELTIIKYCTCASKPFDFSGKHLIFFGDSITYGYIAASGQTPAHQATNPYPKAFAQAVGATFENDGESGTTLAETAYGSIYTKIQNTALSGDFVFVAGGINDWQTGVDEATLKTAVTNICEYLSNNFSGEVIFITPINEAGKTPIATPAQTLQNVRNIITRVALKYGYSVVQGWEFPFPTVGDNADYIADMFQDKLHPTELGLLMYAQALRSALC